MTEERLTRNLIAETEIENENDECRRRSRKPCDRLLIAYATVRINRAIIDERIPSPRNPLTNP